MKVLNACRRMLVNRQRSVKIALLIVGLTLLVSQVVGAQSSGGGMVGEGSSLPQALNVATAVPGGPGFVVLTGASFRPYSIVNTNYLLIGVSLKNIDTVDQYFFAPLQIPNGVTVSKMVVFFSDQDNTKQLEASLIVVGLADSYGTFMAGVPSVDTVGVGYGETTTIVNPVIDLSNNAYLIQLRMPASSNIMFVSARIDYAYQTLLPVVKK